MHAWHCNCRSCRFDSEWLFRAQTDSSCSGEIISTILHHDPTHDAHVADVFDILQEAAVATDAEPGLRAGLHVHVGMSSRSENKRRFLWAFLRSEPMLQLLAAGRFTSQRSNNTSLQSLLAYGLRDFGGTDRYASTPETIAAIEEGNSIDSAMRWAMGEQECADRHSNLNVNTGHGTWEYRLWNSTRSAWRLEMFTRVSVALVDPTVARAMIAAPLPTHDVPSVRAFADLLSDCNHTEAGLLVSRQADYAEHDAAFAPSTLTQV